MRWLLPFPRNLVERLGALVNGLPARITAEPVCQTRLSHAGRTDESPRCAGLKARLQRVDAVARRGADGNGRHRGCHFLRTHRRPGDFALLIFWYDGTHSHVPTCQKIIPIGGDLNSCGARPPYDPNENCEPFGEPRTTYLFELTTNAVRLPGAPAIQQAS